jgi:archaellum component FlaC
MMHLFRKEKFDYNLYDLQLKVEAQQKQISELRELVLELSKQINSLQIEIDYLSNEKYKYGKGL